MKKQLYCAFIILSWVMLTGCGTDYRVHSVINTKKDYAMTWEENHFGHYLDPKNLIDPTSYYIYINPYTYNPAALANYSKKELGNNLSSSFYQLAVGGCQILVTNAGTGASPVWMTNRVMLTDDKRQYYRNELQNALLATIRESTEQHLSELKATENNVNLLLGGATLGLAAGASVAAASSAKVLAAAATGTAGARSLVNEQVYRNTFIEAVVALIEKDQADFLIQVRQLQTNNIYNYTVESAILDAKDYEAHGSFYHGLALLQMAVQKQIAGLTNIVALNQLDPAPRIATAQPLEVFLKTTGTTNIVISGSGFRLMNLSKITNSDPTVQVTESYATGDNQLNLKFATKSANTNSTKDYVEIPYMLQGNAYNLQIPVNIHVTQ